MTRTDSSLSQVVPGVFAALPVSEEATTSRTLVSNDAVRVVSFAMDQGQELTDHSTPHPVVVQVVEGELAFTVGGRRDDLSAGDVVYLAPGDRHAVLALSSCRFVLVMSMVERDAA